MEPQDKGCLDCKRYSALLLLALLIFFIYSNTFYASWHLDDYHNITQNPRLKIRNFTPESLSKTFYAAHDRGLYLGNTLYRPIPCLSFALNWYFGESNLFGYHLVNIIIHFLTAFMLFLTILSLFNSPNLKNKYQDSAYFIALFSAVIWAVNPLQTQAVTYVVQRMASMAAMFYILGMYFYIKGRLNRFRINQIFCYLGSFLGFTLAVASKENAVIFPFALILVEIVFFQDLSRSRIRKAFLWAMFAGSILLILAGVLILFHGVPQWFLETYEGRLFTPLQRLMTEPRVLIFYLSQLFYPVPTRLSIEHDISVSTSLLHPWTTLPSIIIVVMLIVFGFLQLRKQPLLSFAILFFFLNHLIESTIIGLELVFEHRNYLPSMFLFLPVAASFKRLLDYYRNQKRSMYLILITFLTLVVMGFGIGTYIRNMAWATEESLWTDATEKAPESSRACHNLAWGYFELTGQYDMAMDLYPRCLQLKPHSKYHKALTLNNMASICFKRKDFEKAAELWEKAFNNHPKLEFLRYRLAMALASKGDLGPASAHLDDLISKRPTKADYNFLKGSILLKQQRYQEALPYLRKVLKQKPDSIKAMTKLGMAFHHMKDYRRAELFFKNAHSRDPEDIAVLLWLIEINLKTDDRIESGRYMNKLLSLHDVNSVVSGINNVATGMPLSSKELLIHEIASKLNRDFEILIHPEDR